MKKPILSQILAFSENAKNVIKLAINNYGKFFSKNQGAFKGKLNTYQPFPGEEERPDKVDNELVVTTVREKINYLKNELAPELKHILDKEATNASGLAKAELIVDGVSWGEHTTCELLALKNFLFNKPLKDVISIIPVRADDKPWIKVEEKHEQYKNREIYQLPTMEYPERVGDKQEFILENPNYTKALEKCIAANVTPPPVPAVKTSSKNVVRVVGTATQTEFTGADSHINRAGYLRQLEQLKIAVVDALARANKVEAIETNLDTNRVLNYIFKTQ